MGKYCISCLEWKQNNDFNAPPKNRPGRYSARCKACIAKAKVVLRKKCSVCEEDKSCDEFYRRKASVDGLQPLCMVCQKKRDAEAYKLVAPQRIAQAQQYVTDNRDKHNASRRALQKRKMVENKVYHLSRIVRCRLSQVLRGGYKRGKSVEYLGCTFEGLKSYLEAQFLPGMTWENYGTVWHVDHKKPLADVDVSDDAAVREASHYTNLRPLWAVENMSLGGKLRHRKALK